MSNQRQWEYEQLIAPIEDRMMRAVWRIVRDPGETEDAFQEALLTVWKKWDRIRAHPNPQALVLRICINSAHDALRSKVRRGKWVDAALAAEDVAGCPEAASEAVAGAERDAQVLRAIGCLSKNQGRAMLLHAVEEMPYAEISAAMGCREATVRKHVARARTRLRELLSHLIPAVRKEEGSHA